MASPADLSQHAARKRQTIQAQPEPEHEAAPQVIPVETAFLVYRLPTGQVIMDSDINASITPARPPVSHDVVGMANSVLADIQLMSSAPAIAQAVVATVEARQQEAIKQAQDQQLWEAAQKNGKGPRGK